MLIAEEVDVSQVCQEIQALQKQRTWYLKSRIMVANRLQAMVAGYLGYHTGLSESAREKIYREAGKLIKRICEGEDHITSSMVLSTQQAITEFQLGVKETQKEMEKQTLLLPVSEWVKEDDQRGFGIPSLAVVIGESGNLSNYSKHTKIWKRLGCAPFTKDGHTHMGSTWRSKFHRPTTLHASEWEEFGYSPRRRSISYLIGENLVKQNGTGPYRTIYDEKKLVFAEKNPDSGKQHCHRHAMLLATKKLLKNLWREWRDTHGII